MSRWSFPFAHEVRAGCVDFSAPDNCLWLGTTRGQIVTFRLLDQATAVVGAGYTDLVAVLPQPDGLGVLVVEAAGTVSIAARDGADRAQAALVVDLQRPVLWAGLVPGDERLLVLEAGTSVGLLAVDLASAVVTTIAGNLNSPLAATLDAARRLVMILTEGPTARRLTTIDVDTGAASLTDDPLLADAAVLAAGPNGVHGALLATGTGTTVHLLRFDGQPNESALGLVAPIRGLASWHSLLLAVTPTGVEAVEWNLDPGPMALAVPIGPVSVGGYVRVLADVAGAGLTLADLDVIVEEGPFAGYPSAGVEPPEADGRQPILVVVGQDQGEFHLAAFRRSDGQLMARARFRVTSHWPDETLGPALAFTGEQQVFARGFWGGGPGQPQNIKAHPAPENLRVAVVLVSTTNRGYPADATPIRDEWNDRLVGAASSVRAYYEEVSLRNTAPHPANQVTGTTVSLAGGEVFGPLALPNGWGDCFTESDKPGFWSGWLAKETFKQDCAGAFCNHLLDRGGTLARDLYYGTDAVVFVVKTASDSGVMVGTKLARAMYVWPTASGANFFYKTATSTLIGPKPCFFVPDVFPSMMPTDKRFPLLTALVHELGHNLGCDDLYNRGEFSEEVMEDAIGGLDIMGQTWDLAHFSLPNRMRLGWIHPDWMRTFDFGRNPSGGRVTLQAAESLSRSGPPVGRRAGIEIRIRDGQNYYFEYRRTQAGQVGDQHLAGHRGDRIVVGTHVDSQRQGEPARPSVLLLPPDLDGEGPVLASLGQDYEESDVTDPQRMHDFRLVFDAVDPADPNAVNVDVHYVAARRPELQITPAPGRGNWKSPSIDLEGPGGANTVKKGLKHSVVVRVHNAGNLAADNVRLQVAWLPFTTSPGTWRQLPDPPLQSIGPNSTATYRVDWTPPASEKVAGIEVEHFCVRATIQAYVDPLDPSRSEIVVHNNWAQSNFDSTTVKHGSPSERRRTGIAITNPLSEAAAFTTVVEQNSPYFRTCVGNAWVNLDPGQTRMVEVFYESLAGDPLAGATFERDFENGRLEAPTAVSLSAMLRPPDSPFCASPRLWWGAGLSLRAGRRTTIEELRHEGEVVRGQVYGLHNGDFHRLDQGEVTVVLWLAERPEEQFTTSASLEPGGRFTALLPNEILVAIGEGREVWGEALFLGTYLWAAERSGPRRLN